MAEKPETTVTVQMSDELRQQFDELNSSLTNLSTENASLKQMNEALSGELKGASDRIQALEQSAIEKRFKDEVLGRTNDGLMWFGDPEKHVLRLVKLAETFGADSEFVTEYVAEQRAVAAQLHSEVLDNEKGTSRGNPTDSAVVQMNAMANARMKETPGLSFSDALTQIAKESPALYASYQREVTIKA